MFEILSFCSAIFSFPILSWQFKDMPICEDEPLRQKNFTLASNYFIHKYTYNIMKYQSDSAEPFKERVVASCKSYLASAFPASGGFLSKT